MEGRGLREENMSLDNTPPTQSGGSVPTQGVSMPPFKSGYGDEAVGELGAGVPSGLERVRLMAMKVKRAKFTALIHHITPELLKRSYAALNPYAVPGVDGVDTQEFGLEIDANINELWDEIQKGAYKPLPGLRSYIPKQDGSKRPLGIATVRDKVVQRALAEVLGQIYEVDFKDFSYGFRPGRGCHGALDALYMALTT
jgi:hypothetical protein